MFGVGLLGVTAAKYFYDRLENRNDRDFFQEFTHIAAAGGVITRNLTEYIISPRLNNLENTVARGAKGIQANIDNMFR